MSGRYIDCDEAVQGLHKLVKDNSLKGLPAGMISEAIKLLLQLPTADVEKVIRCKKCAHRIGAFCSHPDVCGIVKVTDNHFCGFGEEKQWKNA